MNRLVIFDLDGVLFESRDMHYETLNKALEHYAYPPINHDVHLMHYNGLPTRTKLNMLGIGEEDAALIQREKQAHTLGWVFKNVKRNETLVRLFADLRLHGWKIAVASNAIEVTVVRALQLLGLWELCDFVATATKYVPKPSPHMYEACMSVCDADPITTIIVEDSPIGREGAAKTGASVIIVSGPADVDTAVRHATLVEGTP